MKDRKAEKEEKKAKAAQAEEQRRLKKEAEKEEKEAKALQKKAQQKKTREETADSGEEKQERPSQTVDIGAKDTAQILEAYQQALDGLHDAAEFELHMIGETSLDTSLHLEMPPGLILIWEAECICDADPSSKEAALVLECMEEKSSGEKAVFCMAAGGRIENRTPGVFAVEGHCSKKTSLEIRVEGGTICSPQGNGVHSDGKVLVSAGRIEAWGAPGASAVAAAGSSVQMTGGLIYARVDPSTIKSTKKTVTGEFISPFAPEEWTDGCGAAVAWAAKDISEGHANGSEQDLLHFPKDAYAWWEVDEEGNESICYGRGENFGIIPVGHVSLPAPAAMTSVTDNAVHSIAIIFKAKTPEGDRPVPLNIEWGWDLFLKADGSEKYDNRIAIAACALCNAAYSSEDIQTMMANLGFSDIFLANSGLLNATSAFVLGHHTIVDAQGERTLFAVINRGSQTLTDWKGNIVTETIQQAGYFTDCAKDIMERLRSYTEKYASSEPEQDLFFVTGHSLGGVVTDILAAQELKDHPGKNVFAYTFAAPLAEPSIQLPPNRPIYNIINQKDIVTLIPPRLSYQRLGEENYGFTPARKSSAELADRFFFLSHMDIGKLEEMNSGLKGMFKQPIQTVLWNHSLTTYMAYLLAGGPEQIKREGSFLWYFLQDR